MAVHISPLGLSETKRKLFEALGRGEKERLGREPSLKPRNEREPAPLSPTQEQLWRLETETPGIPPLYNESITIRRNGALDRNLLERSMAEIVRRHEIWRTSYQRAGGTPVQIVHAPQNHFSLQETDLRHLPPSEREAVVLSMARRQAQTRFDLSRGPLWRAMLVRISDAESRIAITAHQSIIDGISVYQLLPAELSAIYAAFESGLNSPLPALPVQFSDFACWHRKYTQGSAKQEQVEFWRRKLSGEIPILHWPNRRRPQQQSYRGKIRSFTIAGPVSSAARTLSRGGRTTLFVALLSSFYLLLSKYTQQTDFIVGTLSPAGRKIPEVQHLMGYFLNPIPLRVDISDDPTFSELLGRVRTNTSEAISNDDVPFEQVAKELDPWTDTSRNPYFTVAISLQPSMPDLGGAWSVTSMDAESGGAKLDLYLAFIQRNEALHLRAQFNPDLFEEQTIKEMIADFETLLYAAAERPQSRLSELQAA
jgi:hypothetical protein